MDQKIDTTCNFSFLSHLRLSPPFSPSRHAVMVSSFSSSPLPIEPPETPYALRQSSVDRPAKKKPELGNKTENMTVSFRVKMLLTTILSKSNQSPWGKDLVSNLCTNPLPTPW